jgi:hypothetical protein
MKLTFQGKGYRNTAKFLSKLKVLLHAQNLISELNAETEDLKQDLPISFRK